MLNWPRPHHQPGRARNAAKALRHDVSGATAIEYALIAGIISLAIIVGAMAIGTNLTALFSAVSAAF